MRHVAHVAHTPHGTRQATLLVCLVGNVLHANEFHVLSLRSLVPLFVLPIVVARILVVVAAVIEAVAIAVAVIWFWPTPTPPRRDLYRGRCNCRRPNAVQIPRKGVKCVKCTDPAECSCLPLSLSFPLIKPFDGSRNFKWIRMQSAAHVHAALCSLA